jgi:hypothetical protein
MKTKKSPWWKKTILIIITISIWSLLFFYILQDWLSLPERIVEANIAGPKAAKVYLGVGALFISFFIANKIVTIPRKTDEELEFDENEQGGYGHIPRKPKDPQK